MEKVVCENPDRGKASTRIDAWKYQLVRRAILKSLSNKGEGVFFKDLSGKVSKFLTADQRRKIGSIGWYTTSVKLDLEAKGLIFRIPKSKPQRLLKK